jgi:ATP phosphoribosyltransferase
MQKMSNGKMTIAVQRPKNREFEKVKLLLEDCKIFFEPKSEGVVGTSNPNIDLVFLPPKDIPKYVEQGVPLGFSAEDMCAECGSDVMTLLKLGFGRVNVGFAAPKENRLNEITDWEDMRIGTALPNLARNFIKSNKGSTAMDAALEYARVIELDGALENAVALGVVDAIVDQIVTGNSLKRAGLSEFKRIMDSEACLIANKRRYWEMKGGIKSLVTMLESVVAGKNKNLVVFNAPPYAVEGIEKAMLRGDIPCGESPTKMPLVEQGAFSYSVMVSDWKLIETVGKLKTLGARDIIVSDVRAYLKGQVLEGTQKTVEELYGTILDRKANPKEGSATNALLSDSKKLGAKIVEEVGEFCEAQSRKEGNYRVASEASDALYAFLVGCAASGFTMQEVLELTQRAQRGELKEFKTYDLAGVADKIAEDLKSGPMGKQAALLFLSNMNETLVTQGIAFEEVVR